MADKKEKSVLDDIPVQEDFGYKTMMEYRGLREKPLLPVVGHCTFCGNPIYGNRTVPPDSQSVPVVIRSCNCHARKDLVMETK